MKVATTAAMMPVITITTIISISVTPRARRVTLRRRSGQARDW
jgi:hypothetical protein